MTDERKLVEVGRYSFEYKSIKSELSLEVSPLETFGLYEAHVKFSKLNGYLGVDNIHLHYSLVDIDKLFRNLKLAEAGIELLLHPGAPWETNRYVIKSIFNLEDQVKSDIELRNKENTVKNNLSTSNVSFDREAD